MDRPMKSPPPQQTGHHGGSPILGSSGCTSPPHGYPSQLALSVTTPTQLSPSVTITPQGRANHVYTIDNILGKVRPPQESPELDVTGKNLKFF